MTIRRFPRSRQSALPYPATLDLNFLVGDTLDPRITFTRASTATYFDSAGVLQSAAINAPRLDYNPSTLAARGFLIEESRTNLCLQSADFSTTWTANNVTITTNAVVSPDSTTNADNIFETTTNGEHYVRQSFTGLTANTVHTITVFVKNLGGRNMRIRVLDTDNTSNGYQMAVSPSLGTVVQVAAAVGAGSSVTGGIAAVNNGWYRVTLSGNAGATCTKYILDFFSLDGTTAIFAGDITKGLTLYGAQLEAGAFPTSYIPTTTVAVTRAADVASVNTLTPWFNAAAGTIYADFAGRVTGAQPYLTMFANTGETERIYQRYVGGQYQGIARVGGVDIAQVYNSSEGSAVNAKMALAYDSSQLAISTNGAAVTGFAVASLASVPSGLNKLWLGSFAGTGAFANAYLRRITYYPVRLSNTDLQAITA